MSLHSAVLDLDNFGEDDGIDKPVFLDVFNYFNGGRNQRRVLCRP